MLTLLTKHAFIYVACFYVTVPMTAVYYVLGDFCPFFVSAISPFTWYDLILVAKGHRPHISPILVNTISQERCKGISLNLAQISTWTQR